MAIVNMSDVSIISRHQPSFHRSGSSWLKIVPYGVRKLLNWCKKNYGNIPIYITENGVSDRKGNLDDRARIYFYKHYITNIFKGDSKVQWVDENDTKW